MKKIVVLNTGSSSIKVKIFDTEYNVILKALLERIGIDGKMEVEWDGNEHEDSYDFKNHKIALAIFMKFLKDKKIIEDLENEIEVIGHRVVNGSENYTKATIATEKVLKDLDKLSPLAPLHNPANISGIKELMKMVSKPNVFVCDTAFHQTMDESIFLYPLPYEIYKKHKVRKYGMHGTSYEYNVKKFEKETGIKNPNLIVFHLGNGSSIAAIKNGKSVNTTMGLTPLAGLMMGTRTGDIDPAIPLFLQKTLNKTSQEVDTILNKQSGMQGISGISSDMRDILGEVEKGNDRAKLTFKMFVDRLLNFYGQYLNQLENKLDGIIFTGGIGYNAAAVLNSFVDNIFISKLELKNNWKNTRIGWEKVSSEKSEFPIFISETDEEIEIAEQSMEAIGKGK